jgi:hypothetical protein
MFYLPQSFFGKLAQQRFFYTEVLFSPSHAAFKIMVVGEIGQVSMLF